MLFSLFFRLMFLTPYTPVDPPPQSPSGGLLDRKEELHKEEEECPFCKCGPWIGLQSSLSHLTRSERCVGLGCLWSPSGIADLDEDCCFACKDIHSKFASRHHKNWDENENLIIKRRTKYVSYL
jgi:hypothetical protein